MNDQLQNLKEHIFGAHRRIGRGAFNGLVFLVYLPLSIVQYYAFKEQITALKENMASHPVYGSTQGAYNGQANVAEAQAILNDQLNTFLAPNHFGLENMVEIATMLAFLPFFMARLRDMGWNPHWCWVLYISLGVKTLGALTGVEIPLTSMFSLAGFGLLAFMCGKNGVEITPPSQRQPFIPPSPHRPPEEDRY